MKNIAKLVVVGLVSFLVVSGCARRCGEPCGPCEPRCEVVKKEWGCK